MTPEPLTLLAVAIFRSDQGKDRGENVAYIEVRERFESGFNAELGEKARSANYLNSFDLSTRSTCSRLKHVHCLVSLS